MLLYVCVCVYNTFVNIKHGLFYEKFIVPPQAFFFLLKQYIFENHTKKKVYFSIFAYRAFWRTQQKVREKCLLQLNK